MDTLTAVAAIRTLDLPALRRRHLCAIAVTAATDADRWRLVFEARQEARRNRQQLEADLKAAYDARRAWGAKNPDSPSGGRAEPLRAVPRPTVHPVVVTQGPITKTAKPRPARRPFFKKNTAVPEVVSVEEKPVKHGLRQYKAGCRCEPCTLAKKASRRPQGKRRPNGEPAPHGTTTSYSRGCRCQPCRDAVAAHARKKYAEKKQEQKSSNPVGR